MLYYIKEKFCSIDIGAFFVLLMKSSTFFLVICTVQDILSIQLYRFWSLKLKLSSKTPLHTEPSEKRSMFFWSFLYKLLLILPFYIQFPINDSILPLLWFLSLLNAFTLSICWLLIYTCSWSSEFPTDLCYSFHQYM